MGRCDGWHVREPRSGKPSVNIRSADFINGKRMEIAGGIPSGFAIPSLRSNTKRKEPGSPLIRRNLPSWATEASRLKGYLALPPEVHPARYTRSSGRIHSRAPTTLETVRLKKPYAPGVQRLGQSDYISWYYARIAPGTSSVLVNYSAQGWNVDPIGLLQKLHLRTP